MLANSVRVREEQSQGQAMVMHDDVNGNVITEFMGKSDRTIVIDTEEGSTGRISGERTSGCRRVSGGKRKGEAQAELQVEVMLKVQLVSMAKVMAMAKNETKVGATKVREAT